MQPTSVSDHYLTFCQTMNQFYRTYADLIVHDRPDTTVLVRRAYLVATFTAALRVTHTYRLFVDAVRQQLPRSRQAEPLARAEQLYAVFQRIVVLVQRHVSYGVPTPRETRDQELRTE